MDCKECVHVENLQRQIDEIQDVKKDIEKRVTKLERKDDANEEKFKTLFNTIDEIKKNIDAINTKLDMLINKPAENWQETMKTVIAVIVTATITFFLRR